MKEKEKIYKYLNGEISNGSFRKWLLKYPDLSSFFGIEDATKLSDLIQNYTNIDKIKIILKRHINLEDYVKYENHKFFIDRCIKNDDLKVTINNLSLLSRMANDENLSNFISNFSYKVTNVPFETEKLVWNEEAYLAQRAILAEICPEIEQKISELKDQFAFDFSE